MRTVYVNGNYLPENEGKVSIFDRGLLFSDSVYEVISVLEGKLVDFEPHIVRYARSMTELKMTDIPSRDEVLAICRQLVARNALSEGVIYLQFSRGNPGDRDFIFPSSAVARTTVGFTQAMALVDRHEVERGLAVVTMPDLRWQMAHVKTTQLLYASLMKNAARSAGADDAWLVRDGFVTEGTSQNAHIVTREGVLVSHPLDQDILHGITQVAVKALARQGIVKIEERPFTVDEAKEALEALNTAASAFVMPVTSIDGVAIGDGKPGPVTRQLRALYIEFARRSAL